MGTRSLVHIKEDGKTLVTLYRQYDGYPTGMGADIKDALNKGKARLTAGGHSGKDASPEVFSGMGCLAAYLIGALKTPSETGDGSSLDRRNAIGNVFVFPVDSSDCGEEFTYTLDTKTPKLSKAGERVAPVLHLEVKAGHDVVYSGALAKFNPAKLEKMVNGDS